MTRREYDDHIHGVVNTVSEPTDVADSHEMPEDATADHRDALR